MISMARRATARPDSLRPYRWRWWRVSRAAYHHIIAFSCFVILKIFCIHLYVRTQDGHFVLFYYERNDTH